MQVAAADQALIQFDRVSAHTSEKVNQRIREQTEHRIDQYIYRPEAIPRRLFELDHEWDIERALEATAAGVVVTGAVLGVVKDRRWFLAPLAIGAFLFQHAIQGWCPPSAFLRRLGFRTAKEIESERTALKIMRGDYAGLSIRRSGHELLNAIETNEA